MIRRFLLGLLIAFAATAPVRAETASKLEEILARGILRVGLTGDYRPFSTLDKSTNQYSGIDVDMAGALAAALGVKLVIVPTTWHDILADIGSGQFDIGMGGVAVTLDRQKRAFYSTPVMRAGVTAIAHCSARSRYRDLRDIDRAGTRVVVNAGSASENFVRANLKNAQATVITDSGRIFEELVAGRVDVMFADVVEVRLQQKLNRDLCAINPDRPFEFGEFAYLLPRDVVWQQYVNQWLRISLESGAHRKIVDAHIK